MTSNHNCYYSRARKVQSDNNKELERLKQVYLKYILHTIQTNKAIAHCKNKIDLSLYLHSNPCQFTLFLIGD